MGTYPFVITAADITLPVPVADGGTGQITAAAAFAGLAPLTAAGDLLIENAVPAPARLAVPAANGLQMLGVSAGLPAWVAALNLQAATVTAGFALQNGTPTLISWTAPSDGVNHRFMVMGNTVITSAETGGAVHVVWTAPGAGATTSAGTDPGGTAPGTKNWTAVLGVLNPGSTVTVAQSSALTVGAAAAFAEIWGS